jgi:hypothetical protein
VPKWCPNGIYCNKTPVPQAEAGVGSIHCGTGNNQFQCVLDASGNPGWKSLAKTCTTGMKNMCPIVVPAPAPAPVPVTKWCPNGLYCNGTPVPQAEAGVNAIVCGGGNNQFQCVLDASGNPGWKSLAKTCTTGMKNMCPSPMYLGCYKDDVGTRALPVRGANTNVAGCLNSAKSGNYKYFGLQFGSPTTGIGECWMGNDLARAQKYGMITGCTQITGALPGYTMGGGNMNALYSV